MAAAVPTKVFVGNLSFKTRDADLARAFEAIGKVSSANIITRGPRSLGYGFVEFVSNDDADKAIAKLNKTELDGRQINVEIAKPREQTEQQPNAAGASEAPAGGARPRRQRKPRAPAADAADSAPAAGASAAPASGSPSAARRRPRKPRAAAGASAAGAPAAATSPSAAPADADAGADGRRPARRGRGRRFGGRGRFGAGRPKSDVPRIASKTTLFVANLHYQIDNNGLAEIFREHNPIKAYVVQTYNGRSRGFGFVEFANETDQQNALKNIDKKVVQDRPLSVKVSQVREETKAVETAAN